MNEKTISHKKTASLTGAEKAVVQPVLLLEANPNPVGNRCVVGGF
jgi:hypothetical protein